MSVKGKFGIIVLLSMTIVSVSAGQQYYTDGCAIPLLVDSSKFLVKFDGGPTQSNVDQLQSSFPRIVSAGSPPIGWEIMKYSAELTLHSTRR